MPGLIEYYSTGDASFLDLKTINTTKQAVSDERYGIANRIYLSNTMYGERAIANTITQASRIKFK